MVPIVPIFLKTSSKKIKIFHLQQIPYEEVVGVSVDVVNGCIAIEVDGPYTSDDGNVIVTTVL